MSQPNDLLLRSAEIARAVAEQDDPGAIRAMALARKLRITRERCRSLIERGREFIASKRASSSPPDHVEKNLGEKLDLLNATLASAVQLIAAEQRSLGGNIAERAGDGGASEHAVAPNQFTNAGQPYRPR